MTDEDRIGVERSIEREMFTFSWSDFEADVRHVDPLQLIFKAPLREQMICNDRLSIHEATPSSIHLSTPLTLDNELWSLLLLSFTNES